MAQYSYCIAQDGNEDWPKRTLDFQSTTADALRKELEDLGEDVETFKSKPAYWLALMSGDYDWLADL